MQFSRLSSSRMVVPLPSSRCPAEGNRISSFVRLFDPKNISFFCVFFCASCATKFFRTNDYALCEWMLLKALWYDAACPWSQGPNFCNYQPLPPCREFLNLVWCLSPVSGSQFLHRNVENTCTKSDLPGHRNWDSHALLVFPICDHQYNETLNKCQPVTGDGKPDHGQSHDKNQRFLLCGLQLQSGPQQFHGG